MNGQTSWQLLTGRRELLYNSLDGFDIESFLHHALSKGIIKYPQLERVKETHHTTEKIDYFIKLCQGDLYRGLADLFLDWLKDRNKSDLYNALVGQGRITPSASNDSLTTDSVTRPAIDLGGESDCESLSSKTKPKIVCRKVPASTEFVQSKMADLDNVYPITSPKKGVALLIVNRRFKSGKVRSGSGLDEEHLREVFSWLGYHVITRIQLTKQEMVKEILIQTRDNHSTHREYGSFILCILSQGDCKMITCVDGDILYLNEVIDLLDNNNFPAMAGKPKFVFLDMNSSTPSYDTGLKAPANNPQPLKTAPQAPIIQAGNKLKPNIDTHAAASVVTSHDNVTIDELKVPYKSDILICHASFLYYPAFHHNELGSLATRVLVEVLYKHAHNTHLTDLLFKVRRKLASIDFNKYKQVCTAVDTLTKDFYLFPSLS